ncbi:GCN5 family acetyltransferase [alpha proteobacterium AAP38]|uniref:GNAT family N-acetyltransferase n=1 Tax=Niveispirillum sp. TaxID=1917217 RepID=UPI0006B96DA8|nr:GCN5 family acetyltransferase [alpha proteobacterium AAP38]
MHIRTATAADAAAIAAIYAPHVSEGTASYESVPPDTGEMAMRMAAIQAQGFPYLVAERFGQVLGYAYGSPFRSRPGYRFTVENSIYVAPEAQGAGVGRALLKALIDQCTRAGYRRMVAVIGDGSNEGSVGLHRALGFELAGSIPGLGVKHGRWLDWVMMVRPLGDPQAPPPGPDEHPGLPPALL